MSETPLPLPVGFPVVTTPDDITVTVKNHPATRLVAQVWLENGYGLSLSRSPYAGRTPVHGVAELKVIRRTPDGWTDDYTTDVTSDVVPGADAGYVLDAIRALAYLPAPKPDVTDMEYMEDITPGEVLIFRWSGGTVIEIGRPENDEYIWDQSIGVYDHATGKIEIENTYAAFKAKVNEWITDQRMEAADPDGSLRRERDELMAKVTAAGFDPMDPSDFTMNKGDLLLDGMSAAEWIDAMYFTD